jgi:hypothetical protein
MPGQQIYLDKKFLDKNINTWTKTKMPGQKQKCLNKTEMCGQQQIYLDKNINACTETEMLGQKQKCSDKTEMSGQNINTWENAWAKSYTLGQKQNRNAWTKT